MMRFRPDNTEGYDTADLVRLNHAWETLDPPDEDGDVGLHEQLDFVSACLLDSYDLGNRGDDLVAFFYAPAVR